MKRNRKGFWAGMLTMLLIVSLVGTAAATYGKVTKELEYRDISVTLNGVKLNLRDAQGRAAEPFMFDGTNYLPVRALAEALGLSVSWDGTTNTVVMTGNIAGQGGAAGKTGQEEKPSGTSTSQNSYKLYPGTQAPMLENAMDINYVRTGASSGMDVYYYLTIDMPRDEGNSIGHYLDILAESGFYALGEDSSVPLFFLNSALGQTVVIDFKEPADGYDDYYMLISIMK